MMRTPALFPALCLVGLLLAGCGNRTALTLPPRPAPAATPPAPPAAPVDDSKAGSERTR